MKTLKCLVAHKALLILAAEHLHIKVLYSKHCCFPFIILKLSVRCRTGKTRSNEEKYRKILWCLKSVLWLEKVTASHHLQVAMYPYWEKVLELPVMGNSCTSPTGQEHGKSLNMFHEKSEKALSYLLRKETKNLNKIPPQISSQLRQSKHGIVESETTMLILLYTRVQKI